MPPKRKPSNSMDGALSPSAILNEVGGPSHSQMVVDPSASTFTHGELVLCEYYGQRYPAKILEVATKHEIDVINASRPSRVCRGSEHSVAEGNSGLEENQVLFFVHYIRWSHKWNEWVPEDRLCKFERKPELKVAIINKIALKLKRRTQISHLKNSVKTHGLKLKPKIIVKQEPQSPKTSIADDVAQIIVKQEPQSPKTSIADDAAQNVVKRKGKKRLHAIVKVEEESPLKKCVTEQEVTSTSQCLGNSNPPTLTTDNIASATGSFKTHQSSPAASTSQNTQENKSSPQVLIKETETLVKEEPVSFSVSESFEEPEDLHLTENLINVLLRDKSRIQHKNMLIADSCVSVNDVLVEYVASVEQTGDIFAISRTQSFISGLRMQINDHVSSNLLYEQEIPVVEKKLEQGLPEDLGAIYLLRLLTIFVKLLKLDGLKHKGPEVWTELINEKVQLIRFLESRSALYFPSSTYTKCAVVEKPQF